MNIGTPGGSGICDAGIASGQCTATPISES